MTLQLITHNKTTSLKACVKSIQSKCQILYKMNQTHSNTITITPSIHSPTKKIQTISDSDGLITTSPLTALSVTYADCLPIIIYHPKPALCVIHAGRKGTKNHITQHAITLLNEITSDNKHYEIYFGAHIHESCYEICKKPHKSFSLIKENQKQLNSILKPEDYTLNISPKCTCCSTHFHSYRGDNKTKKRNRTFAYFTP